MLEPQLISIAQQAWEAVKEDSQPSWNDCIASHRQRHLTAAKAVLKGGPVITAFEQKVRELSKVEDQSGHLKANMEYFSPENEPNRLYAQAPTGVRYETDTGESMPSINYALPHSQFVKECAERTGEPLEPEIDLPAAAEAARASAPVAEIEQAEAKLALIHGDEELAAQAGVQVDQHETKGAAEIGKPPVEKPKRSVRKLPESVKSKVKKSVKKEKDK